MDSVHDVAGVDPWRETLEPWRESLARSRARRGKPMPSAAELTRWRAKREPTTAQRQQPQAAHRARSVHRGLARRPRILIASPAGMLAVGLLAMVVPIVSSGRTVRAPSHRAPATPRSVARPATPAHQAKGAGFGPPGACQTVDRGDGYLNPVAHAKLTPKRVDQGVDYAGTGQLTALGAGTVTTVATSDTGWPGAFLEYRLSDGPAAGCYVFYAEGIVPAAHLRPGATIRPGQPIATLIPGYSAGIEVGWGSGKGTMTYAAQLGEWSATADQDNIATAAGKSFSRLIQSLGGPPGKIKR
jgi:hypothetical protein